MQPGSTILPYSIKAGIADVGWGMLEDVKARVPIRHQSTLIIALLLFLLDPLNITASNPEPFYYSQEQNEKEVESVRPRILF